MIDIPDIRETTIDLNLVHKLILDPLFVVHANTGNISKLNLKFKRGPDLDDVILTMTWDRLNINIQEIIRKGDLSKMLYKCLTTNIKLSNLEEFKQITALMADQMIAKQRKEGTYSFFCKDKIYNHASGIGVVVDTNTNNNIGVFESFTMNFPEEKIAINYITLVDRSLSDLTNSNCFKYKFYCLETNRIYESIQYATAKVSQIKNKKNIEFKRFCFQSEEFSSSNPYYKIVAEAQAKKALINDIKDDHPLYEINHVKFNEFRLNLLNDWRQKTKKEKILKQFSDIDLGF